MDEVARSDTGGDISADVGSRRSSDRFFLNRFPTGARFDRLKRLDWLVEIAGRLF